METFINSLIDNYNIPLLTAFLLGILTSISPCPLATNIAAVGFLSKEIKTAKNTLFNALFYIIGRGISYTLVAGLIYFGFSEFAVAGIFQGWGEKLLAPVLIIMGLFMLGIFKIKLNVKSEKWENFKHWLSGKGYLGSLGLGMIFAMAFCPYSGVLFFGMLMPLILKSTTGILLAPIFAIGTGLPVAVFASLMVISLQKMSKAYQATRRVEKWLRYIVAFLFIGTGFYYLKYTFGVESFDIFYPFEAFAAWLTFSVFGIAQGSHLGKAIEFFIYDTLKIGLLLIVINYVMAITRYYFPIEKIRGILTKNKWYGLDYLLAAILGVITPFCSCSSIPLFIGFVSAGIPLGVTFAFLIASPLVNEASLFIFPSMFGLKITLIYNTVGIFIAMLAGMIIQKLKMDKNVNPDFLKFTNKNSSIEENGGKEPLPKERLIIWWKDGLKISKSIFPYVLLGVGLGSLIHGFVPSEFVEAYLVANDWWAVPLAVIIGMPLYANSVSVIPVIEALTGKGIPLGTSLAFMTSTVTLSIPGLLILKKAMNWKLLTAFIMVTSIGIIVIGYLFNWIF